MTLTFTNSDLLQKVDRLMDELWAGGVNNPMTAIEQISFLMFLKSLTEMDEKQEQLQRAVGGKHSPTFSNSWSKYSWRTMARLSGDPLYVTLSEAIEKLHELPRLSLMGKELFKQAHLKIFNRPTLKSVVSIIDGMDYNNTQKYDTDVKGDLYEYLLSKISISGTNGQFRTPRHIIKMMVQILDPKPGQYILDPACGTAGFLIEAYHHIMEQNTSAEDLKEGHVTGNKLKPHQHQFLKSHALTGYDNDTDMIKISIMNLYLHGLEGANVRYHDPLTLPTENDRKYDIILANPPFAGTINKEAILEDFELQSAKTELLFGEYFYKHLASGGKAAVIVPEGVLMGPTKAHLKLRSWLLNECTIHGVISLHSSVFKPYASVKTYILIFERGGKTKHTWMYNVEFDGYSNDGTRRPIPENDIPDLIDQWNQRHDKNYIEVAGKHGWTSAQDIIEHNYEMATRIYLRLPNISHKYKEQTIKELCTLIKGKVSAAKADSGNYPLVTTAEDYKCCSSYQFEGEAVCVPLVSSTGHGHASIKRLTYINGKFAAATIIAVLQAKELNQILPRYLYYFLETNKDELLVPLMKGGANVSLSLTKIASVKIPVPSLREQKVLISELIKVENKLKIKEAELADLYKSKDKALSDFKAKFSNKQ